MAAARYLKDLYKIFGDWNLVIAAYNCGPENINKAIHRAGGEKDYWQIYPYLPKETRGYVPAFIAANYIMTYYSLHNICPMSTRLPAKSDTVVVNKNLHLQQVAEVVGINIDLLRSLNPMYRRDVIPGATTPSVLRLPLTETTRFIDLQDSVFSYKSDELLTTIIRASATPEARKDATAVTRRLHESMPRQAVNVVLQAANVVL